MAFFTTQRDAKNKPQAVFGFSCPRQLPVRKPLNACLSTLLYVKIISRLPYLSIKIYYFVEKTALQFIRKIWKYIPAPKAAVAEWEESI